MIQFPHSKLSTERLTSRPSEAPKLSLLVGCSWLRLWTCCIVLYVSNMYICDLSAQEIPFVHFKPGIDFPASSIYSEIVQLEDGELLLVTESGLVRYDGSRFRTIDDLKIPNQEFIFARYYADTIISLIDFDGGLFFFDASRDEIVEYKSPVLESREPVDYALDHYDSDIFYFDYFFRDSLHFCAYDMASHDTTVLKTVQPFYSQYAKFTQINDIDFYQRFYRADGDSGKSSCIFSSASSKVIDSTVIDRNWHNIHVINARAETLAFVDINKKDQLILVRKKGGGYSSEIYSFPYSIAKPSYVFMGRGLIGLVLDKGCMIVDTSGQILIGKDSPLSHIKIHQGLIDNQGKLWMGTNGDGLIHYPSLSAQHYTAQNSFLTSDYVTYVGPGADTGEVLVATIDGNWTILHHGEAIESFVAPSQTTVYNIWSTPDAHLELNPQLPFSKEVSEGVAYYAAHGSIKWITEARNRDLYVARRELRRYPLDSTDTQKLKSQIPSSKRTHAPGQVISDKMHYSLYEDQFLPRIWLCSFSGLAYYDYIRDTVIKVKMNGAHLEDKTKSIAQSLDSSIWVASQNNGVYIIRGDTVHSQTTQYNGLINNRCNTLLADDKGRIWVGTDSGITVIDASSRKSIAQITRSDGLISEQVNSLWLQDDQVWIGTAGGLFNFKEKDLFVKSQAPSIAIRQFNVNGEHHPHGDAVVLSPSSNSISFDFDGVAVHSMEDLNYSYRLIGAEDEWKRVNSQRTTAIFPSLRPGKYRFEVKAINEDGIESIENAYQEFRIRPSAWLTPWPYIGVAGVLTLLTLLANRYVRKRDKRDQELEQLYLSSRLSSLRAQMNPHFIFNALNSIQLTLLQNRNEESMENLSIFSDLMRHIFQKSDQSWIYLEEEIRFLRHYMTLEKNRFGNKVTTRITVEEDLDISGLLIPPLIVQPFVENAFKHGLFHLERPGYLHIEFKRDNQYLKVIIEDNGIGRHLSAKKANKSNKSNKTSTQIICDRIRVLNKRSFNKSTPIQIHVNDLVSEGTQNGTQVTLSFPLTTSKPANNTITQI